MSRQAVLAMLAALAASGRAAAHEHHEDKIPEGDFVSPEPLDSILWIHILVQTLAWGLIFPVGMVYGMVRSRWHVPIQVTGTMLAIAGYFLGHKHKGRQFAPNIHATFAISLGWMLAMQILIGIYLRFHLQRGVYGRIRRWLLVAHGIIGKIMPVVTWVQMLFGGITAMGFCHDEPGQHLGQCLAHFIMGSAFIGYGIVLIILLLAGQFWLRRTGRSQEFFDSSIIAAWGCVNTFTEHRWGQEWHGNDLQHTSMGVVWWCAGLLGMWLSRTRDGRPQRNIVPAMVILVTGWAMSAHSQHLMLSTMVHGVFGYTLMAAGAARIVEISFVLRDQSCLVDEDVERRSSFQMLTPLLLIASGFLFMGATEEQLALLSGLHVTHVSYILLLYSLAFLMVLFVSILLTIYVNHTWPLQQAIVIKPNARAPGAFTNGSAGTPNGHVPNGDGSRSLSRDPMVRDAEEFELEGLMSESDEEGTKKESKSSARV